MKKIVCKADYLKLHATSEMTDSGNPGVLSHALRDRLRYLVLYLRPFFLSNESVQEATEPVAKGKRGSPRGNRASRQRQARQPMHNTAGTRKHFVSFLQFSRWLEDFLNRVTARAVCFYFSFLSSAHTVQYWISDRQDLRPHDK